jgi:O-antigen/teichoic acid export membrane protein
VSLIRTVLISLRSNQVLSLTGNLVVAGLNIITISLLFRALPAAEIGSWVFFITAFGLADACRAGFLTTGFIRSYAGATFERAAEVVGSTWAIAIALTAGITALSLLAKGVLAFYSVSLGTALVLNWLGLSLVLTLPTFMAASVLQGELRFGAILVLRLLSQGLFVLSIIGLILSKAMSLDHVMNCYLIAAFITGVIVLSMGWTRIGDLRHRRTECIKQLVHFGKFSIGSFVGASMLRSSDTFIINFMLGPAALAVYNLAQRFVELIDLPLRSFLSTAIPSLSAAFNQNDMKEVGRLLRKNAGLLTWALTPIVLVTMMFADLPIILIGGNKYVGTPAANLLRIIIFLSLLFPIDRFTGVTLDVINQPRINLYKVFIMLGVNVLCDITGVLILKNVYGIALANLPTIVVGFAYGYVQLKKFMPVSIKAILATGLDEIKGVFLTLRNKAPILESTRQDL